MGPKPASAIPFRGIGTEVYFARLPITQGHLPEEFIGRVLRPEALTVHPAFSSAPWERRSREKARSQGPAVGNTRRRTFSQICVHGATGSNGSQSSLVYVLLCKNTANPQRVRSVLAPSYVRTNIQVKRRAGFLLIAEKPGSVRSIPPVDWRSLKTFFLFLNWLVPNCIPPHFCSSQVLQMPS